jgi:LuxR family maltose regulon positive regulatory protein
MPQKTDNSIEAVGSSYLLWTGWHTSLTKLTFAPESPEWFTWLGTIPSFRFESKRGKYTARKEQRAQGGGDYWIAYVKNHNKLYKKYVGPTDKLTLARLEEVAEELTHLFGNSASGELPKGSSASIQS